MPSYYDNPYRRRRRRSYRRNPSLSIRNPGPVIAGHDTGDLAAMAGGLVLADAIDQQVARPLTRQWAPSGAFTAKLYDAVTTAGAASLAGWAVGMANRRAGHNVSTGGWALAVGRAMGAFVPGLAIQTSVPGFIRFPSFGQPSAMASAGGAAAAALPAASQPIALGTVGARSAGF